MRRIFAASFRSAKEICLTATPLTTLLRRPETILLESSRPDDMNGKNFLFHSPEEILRAETPDEIPTLFERMEHHLRRGKWIAGYLSYEAGYHFEPAVVSSNGTLSLPLVRFGVYSSPQEASFSDLDFDPPAHPLSITPPRLTISDERYATVIAALKKYIVDGDTYQVNFTDRFEFECDGDPLELYRTLRRKQHVPFGAFLNLGERHILSFSPELFFRRSGKKITVRPMKGTCQRGRTTVEDRRWSEWLRNDEKNRSENLMIVDLLRNDLGRICEPGSVTVRSLYDIEKYETVLQMTSTIDGSVRPDRSYYDIFSALFPCGSVTGAPKIRTMQIIREAEQHPRGIYCGAIGYISPHHDAVFSVAIRTVLWQNGHGIMGAGSGIVHDSVAEKELAECRLKGAFLTKKETVFSLLETILWNGRFTYVEEHISRLEDSAQYFSIPFDRQHVLDSLRLAERAFDIEKKFRIRLLLSRSGQPTVEAVPFVPTHSSAVVRIASDRIDSADPMYFHKTTHRPLYDRYRTLAEADRIAEYIFLNERGEATEGCISNLFVEKNGRLFTPPVSSGLLAGIYRNDVLRTNPNASEKVLFRDDLQQADALYICNSVRGWTKVTLSE